MPLANVTAWPDRLDELVTRLCDCLADDTPQGAPSLDGVNPNCYKIHSDEWPGDCCNSLILRVIRVYPQDATTGFPNQDVGNARNTRCGSKTLLADVQIRLSRPCGVTPTGSNLAFTLPSGLDLDDEADLSLIDINALMCCLVCDPGFSDRTTQFYLGAAVPFKTGDCGGWTISGTVSMPNCAFV